MGDAKTGRPRRGTLAGELVAGHELIRVLAAGGMGEVYLARHRTLGMERAIKVIRTDLREDGEARERFTREAQVLARLQHNSIVQLIDFGELPNGWPFLAMEFIDGPNLDQVVEARMLPLNTAVFILDQIAAALYYAHEQNVVHRDLKPGNVLLRANDMRQVKVIDFGLAYTHGPEAQKRLTVEGQMVGSPLYMAPEQADGQLDVTQAVDVYAFAGIAYTLITGTPPFAGKSLLQLIAAHADEIPPRISSRIPTVPPFLDELLFACLAKRPEHRPHSEELVGHFARLARQAEAAPQPSRTVMPVPPAQTPPPMTAQPPLHTPMPARPTPAPAPPASPPPEAHAPPLSMHATVSVNSRPTTASSSIQLALELPPPEDGTGVGHALANQILAVVGEIASNLSSSDRELAQLLRDGDNVRDALTDLEMEVALVDSRLEETPVRDRRAIELERQGLEQRINTLQAAQLDVQRRLIARIETQRHNSSATVTQLFRELDHAVAQIDRLRRSLP